MIVEIGLIVLTTMTKHNVSLIAVVESSQELNNDNLLIYDICRNLKEITAHCGPVLENKDYRTIDPEMIGYTSCDFIQSRGYLSVSVNRVEIEASVGEERSVIQRIRENFDIDKVSQFKCKISSGTIGFFIFICSCLFIAIIISIILSIAHFVKK